MTMIRFLSGPLSSFVSNLSDGLYSDKCIDCKSCLNNMLVKDDQQSCTQLIFRCFSVKRIVIKTLIRI